MVGSPFSEVVCTSSTRFLILCVFSSAMVPLAGPWVLGWKTYPAIPVDTIQGSRELSGVADILDFKCHKALTVLETMMKACRGAAAAADSRRFALVSMLQL